MSEQDEMIAAAEKLYDEATEMMKSANCQERVEGLAFTQAFLGDEGFMSTALSWVARDVAEGNELKPHARLFLWYVLTNACDDLTTCGRLSGKAKRRGAPTKRAKGYFVAAAVANAVFYDGAKNMDAAWALVAERHHLSESAVKKYWIEWKDCMPDLFGEPERFSEALAEALSRNRLG